MTARNPAFRNNGPPPLDHAVNQAVRELQYALRMHAEAVREVDRCARDHSVMAFEAAQRRELELRGRLAASRHDLDALLVEG